MLKIIMASDHTGLEMKAALKAFMESLGHEVTDIGPYDTGRVEYPTYGYNAANKLVNEGYDRAVLVCGTGFGISLAANSVNGVRCVNCTDVYTAQLSRLHNNANAIAIGARVLGIEYAKMLVETWLNTAFEGGRHGERVEMLTAMCTGEYHG